AQSFDDGLPAGSVLRIEHDPCRARIAALQQKKGVGNPFATDALKLAVLTRPGVERLLVSELEHPSIRPGRAADQTVTRSTQRTPGAQGPVRPGPGRTETRSQSTGQAIEDHQLEQLPRVAE